MANVASFRELREEVYFDSIPSIESDCEDFFSVNGDFPTCGNTPIHDNNSIENAPLDIPHRLDGAPNCASECASTDTKKQLKELFHESFYVESSESAGSLPGFQQVKPVINLIPEKSTGSASDSYERCRGTPHTVSSHGKRKSSRSINCCLPNLVRSLSSCEKKKRLSVADASGQVGVKLVSD